MALKGPFQHKPSYDAIIKTLRYVSPISLSLLFLSFFFFFYFKVLFWVYICAMAGRTWLCAVLLGKHCWLTLCCWFCGAMSA